MGELGRVLGRKEEAESPRTEEGARCPVSVRPPSATSSSRFSRTHQNVSKTSPNSRTATKDHVRTGKIEPTVKFHFSLGRRTTFQVGTSLARNTVLPEA